MIALQRVHVVAVAAANRHSAALSAVGEVFTWGANNEGQVRGYALGVFGGRAARSWDFQVTGF